MKSREYCCCAIPIINAGILATLVEQLSVAAIVGTLSITTPSSKLLCCKSSAPFSFYPVVGANTPPFASWVLGAVCYVLAAVQVLGIIGVSRVRSSIGWSKPPDPIKLLGKATAVQALCDASWTRDDGSLFYCRRLDYPIRRRA